MAQLPQLRPAFVSSNAQIRPAWLESVPIGPTIIARTLHAINLQTGQVLYSKGTAADDNEPGSLTKLMTAYVLTQQKTTLAALAQTTIITAADVLDGGAQDMVAGDVISLHDLLIRMLLPSDNSASSAIARVIGLELLGGTGTEEQAKSRFYSEMNTQAALLGMTDTTFTSAHGLSFTDASSCPDINLLLARLARNAIVRDIWRYKKRTITLTRSGVPTLFTVTDSNAMAGQIGIIGGKPGSLNRENLGLLWEAPNGQLLAITLIGSDLGGVRYIDMAAVIAALPVDYPALATPSVPFTPAYLFDTLGFAGGWWDSTGTANKWQDAAGTTPVTAAAQPLGKWTPRSGTGTLAFSQAATGARPLYQGGATGVQFDGTDDYLDLGAGSFGTASLFADSGQKYMVAQKFAVTGTSGTVIAKAGAVTTGRTFHSYADQVAGEEPAVWVRGAQTLIDKNIVNGASHAVDFWWDGSQGGMSTDQAGTLGLLIGTAAQETQNITLGARTGGTANFLTGSVQQIVLTDRYDIDSFRRLRDWSNGGAVNAFGYSAGYADGGAAGSASTTNISINLVGEDAVISGALLVGTSTVQVSCNLLAGDAVISASLYVAPVVNTTPGTTLTSGNSTRHSLKLVVPASTMPVTLAEVKTSLRVDTADDDVLIESLIYAATETAEQMLGRAIMPQTWQLTHDEFPWMFELTRSRVISVVSLTYIDVNGLVQTLSASSYALDNSDDYGFAYVVPALGTQWPLAASQMNAVVLTYQAGYNSAADVPRGVRAWIMLLVRQMYDGCADTAAPTSLGSADRLLDGARIYQV